MSGCMNQTCLIHTTRHPTGCPTGKMYVYTIQPVVQPVVSCKTPFMRAFNLNSSLMIRQCQVNFGILPISCQLKIRTAKFLQKFLVLENPLCVLFAQKATTQFAELCSPYGKIIRSAAQLNDIINDQFYSTL
jgi:hypothetical protein